MKKIKNIIPSISVVLILAIGLCFLYNLYALFFPISTQLEGDATEHLHAVYLLSIGKRPYLDFIQNHPMLFHHFLLWVKNHFHMEATRSLAMVGRVVVFGHFLLCLAVFCLWTSRVLKHRSKAVSWAAMLTASWAMLDIYNPDFHWTWNIRPDFICYGQTLLGLYLIYLWIARPENIKNRWFFVLAVVGGCFIGLGNAVLPKGVPFVAAFALTLFVHLLSEKRSCYLARENRTFIYGFLIIGGAIFFSFVSGMLLDCHLSNVPVRSWTSAVFLLNSKKHIIFGNTETSPVTHLINFLSIPMPLAIAFMAWVLWELIALGKPDRLRGGTSSILLFSIFTIIINIILPSYSNGVTWSYYFVPSLFAIAAICLLLLLRLRDFYKTKLFEGPLSIPKACAILIGFFIGIHLLNAPVQLSIAVGSRAAVAREVAETNLPDFVNDVILPKEFVYLGYPYQMPIESQNWGYYFMLNHSTGFWKDCYTLGLGPDPQKVWSKNSFKNPPDAITFTKPDELSTFIFTAEKCQQIDISWLRDEIQNNYILMVRPGAALYILKSKAPVLEVHGWRKITNDHGIDREP